MRIFLIALVLLPLVLASTGGDDEYHDLFASGKKEWRLAFRGTAGAGQSVYNAYTTTSNADVDAACKGSDWTAACTAHYRNNDALDQWLMVEEVLLGVVKDGLLVKTFKFDGAGSTSLDWFSEDRLQESCYKDIQVKEKDYFSIEGSSDKRRFFISENSDGCSTAGGWFVAIDAASGSCGWENVGSAFPVFKYSVGASAATWDDASADEADAFVVFIRHNQFANKQSEFFDIFDDGQRQWRLVFRATANVGHTFYDAFSNGRGIPATVDEDCKNTNWAGVCNSHYRNVDALDNYYAQGVKEVLVAIVKDGFIVKTITFDGTQSSNSGWFAHRRILDSCWSDFHKSKDYFSLRGNQYSITKRTFYINHSSRSGCSSDAGWMMAVDNTRKAKCAYERQDEKIPILYYSPGPTMAKWDDAEKVAKADAFVIFFKYNDN